MIIIEWKKNDLKKNQESSQPINFEVLWWSGNKKKNGDHNEPSLNSKTPYSANKVFAWYIMDEISLLCSL